ncbi:response regulator [Deminuibacter soli]|uniref:histidine kinase n=1 Tax=Deminuibacter soli TaxID=2291815 RepID=A0A3E1NPU7_9BACT|nr:response regulator [Deminuibacter soli]RFM29956.1 response regulator [Deminuibacter soli]
MLYIPATLIICLFLIVFILLLLKQSTRLRTEARKQVEDARKAEAEMTQSKAQFLATVNHAIRTPLNSAIGLTSLLMQTPLSEEQKKYVSNIHHSNVSLLSVINDMLVFSKIESGSLQLEQVPFGLKRSVREVLSLLNASAGNHLSIASQVDEQVPDLILGDHSRLRQVLINLLSNAQRQAADGSGIMLKISLKSRQDDAIEILFAIEDNSLIQPITGSMLIPDHHANVHALSMTTDQTGLGLSVSTRLVALMGGTFKMETIAGKGNFITFTIKGRMLKEPFETEPDGETTEAAALIDNTLAQQMPLRILIVDDNDMNQFMLTSLLGKMGYQCVVAKNGAEAVALAIEHTFDLIFMDLYMPVMDGLEATRRIREYFLTGQKPVIVGVTANALISEKEIVIRAGFNDFLLKPYKMDDIRTAVLKWGEAVKVPE